MGRDMRDVGDQDSTRRCAPGTALFVEMQLPLIILRLRLQS